MLKGEAKKTYQREYMRGYMRDLRLKQRLLRPSTLKDACPNLAQALGELSKLPQMGATNHWAQGIDADGNAIYED